MLRPRILMHLRSIPELMRFHLSFRRIALTFLSSDGKSGLIETDVSEELLCLKRMLRTSAVELRVTNRGRLEDIFNILAQTAAVTNRTSVISVAFKIREYC